MVDRGMAWHYKRFEAEQTPEQGQAQSAAERAAQGAKWRSVVGPRASGALGLVAEGVRRAKDRSLL